MECSKGDKCSLSRWHGGSYEVTGLSYDCRDSKGEILAIVGGGGAGGFLGTLLHTMVGVSLLAKYGLLNFLIF